MLNWLLLNSAVLTKRSEFKIEVGQDQRQFKDIPSSTCLNSSERRALDVNSRGPGFNANYDVVQILIAHRVSRKLQCISIYCTTT